MDSYLPEQFPNLNARQDILRFSKLHKWYKILPYPGKPYLIFPWQGQQPKNPFDPQIEDYEGIHWWFWDADLIDEIPISGKGKEIIMTHAVTFNCFLRGLETAEDNKPEYFMGWNIIENRDKNVRKKLLKKYPEIRGKTNCESLLAVAEHSSQIGITVEMAREIYSLLKERATEWLNINEENVRYEPKISPRLRQMLCLGSTTTSDEEEDEEEWKTEEEDEQIETPKKKIKRVISFRRKGKSKE